MGIIETIALPGTRHYSRVNLLLKTGILARMPQPRRCFILICYDNNIATCSAKKNHMEVMHTPSPDPKTRAFGRRGWSLTAATSRVSRRLVFHPLASKAYFFCKTSALSKLSSDIGHWELLLPGGAGFTGIGRWQHMHVQDPGHWSR